MSKFVKKLFNKTGMCPRNLPPIVTFLFINTAVSLFYFFILLYTLIVMSVSAVKIESQYLRKLLVNEQINIC